MIQVSNFCKAYDNALAVNDLSFEVESGQVLGLVGPNGAGKTTTLRALLGIIPSSGGRLEVAGFDLATNPIQVKQRAAYVPDDPQLFHDLSVEQHLAFAASAYAVEDAEAKIDRLLERFQLEAKRHTPAADLSRGMRQKLAICCAYLYDPVALLLDEPMTGLDPPGIRNLKDSIVERAEEGAAVIISSHLLAMVEDICTHVLILNTGEKKFLGTLDELRTRFSNSDSDGKGGEQDKTSLEDIFFRAIDSNSEATEATEASKTSEPTELAGV